MYDIIQGNKFKDLAKWHYAPESGQGIHVKNTFPRDHYCYIVNTLDKSKVVDGDIIYTPTFFADSLIEELKDFDKKVIVITHNCDTNMDFSPPGCVIRWFSQNVNIIHDRVESIPIGLENDCWWPEKKVKMMAKLQEPKQYKNLVYMNHNIATNPAKRTKPYELLKDKSWVTTNMGENGYGFDSYIDNIYNHKFVICPEGNGIDTHRIWECLYMGTTPIMESNINGSFYNELPIAYAVEWDWVDELWLKQIEDYLVRYKDAWKYEMLTFGYWRDKIYGLED